MVAADRTRVSLEVGKSWVFASTVDWPGWCRRGKGEQAALDALLDYAPRYRAAVGRGFAPGDLTVIGRVAGSATTDFGAPGSPGDWDAEPMPAAETKRQTALLQRIWTHFDEEAAAAPAQLRKGPRGGGRDRDGIVEHVREAERSYARKIGVRAPPRTPWPEQRAAIVAGLARPGEQTWPVRYLIRRIAWHVLDHAWEIQDRSEG